jgi:hypothetical protein
MKKSFSFRAKVWLYPGLVGWHFVTVPKKISVTIKEAMKGKTKGWGSVPVSVTVGKTTWQTSIFPEKTSGCYLLPLKVTVRKKEEIEAEDTVLCTLAF